MKISGRKCNERLNFQFFSTEGLGLEKWMKSSTCIREDSYSHEPQQASYKGLCFLIKCFAVAKSSSSTREHCARAVSWDIFSWPWKSLDSQQANNTACHNWTQPEQSTLCTQQHFRPLSHSYHITRFELHLLLTGRHGRATKSLCAPNNMCTSFKCWTITACTSWSLRMLQR